MTVRILHTSDWHAGKSLRGRSRADEHRAVFAEIAGIARTSEVDLVLVVGDLFDTAAPGPEAEQIVWQALLDLADTGASVVALAGNHDHPARFDAARAVAGPAGPTTAACWSSGPGPGSGSRSPPSPSARSAT